MRRVLICLGAVVGLLAGCQYTPGVLPPIEIYFSPQGGCTEAIVYEIHAARQGILVQAYSFTAAPIAKAIVEAHKRGVAVDVILDKSHKTEAYSSADFLLHAGIPVKIDPNHAIAHNKIMIIDGRVVITGSFNFTKAAEEHNAENLLIIRDEVIAGQYTANWKAHAAHSEPYIGKEAEVARATPGDKPRPARHAGALQEGGYVSSVKSQVFHKADCPAAAKISPQNLVRFAARDEAIQAGKKPCQECEP
jgi:phosphatidylserine/phosphatidylglycerophosphate/cardiolipin synthase-like enzyme